jgi:hypothetical protein
MMNMTIKSAVIAAIGLAGAAAANAGTIQEALPSTGNSDLIFFINDASAGTTYARVLTQSVSSLFTYQAGTGTQNAITTYTGAANFSVATGADSAEQTFISTAEAAGDTLQWGIIAGAYTNPASTPGNAVAIATDLNPAAVEGVGNSDLTSTMLSTGTGLGKDITKLVSKTADAYNATTQGVIGTPTSQSGTSLTFYGTSIDQSGLALGSSSTLYAMTASNNPSAGTATLPFSLGTITLSADGTTLSFTGNPGTAPVPLPAAVWLFGSGLLGLVGVGRRRIAKTESA